MGGVSEESATCCAGHALHCTATGRHSASAACHPAQHPPPRTWSPSQSLPLIVSYACHRQSSTVMLPSAALMPPCAATVWLRVGNSLVMQLRGWGEVGERREC
jgi:hypothetical protein